MISPLEHSHVLYVMSRYIFRYYFSLALWSSEAGKRHMWWMASTEHFLSYEGFVCWAAIDAVFISKSGYLRLVADVLRVIVPMPDSLARLIDDYVFLVMICLERFDLVSAWLFFHHGQPVDSVRFVLKRPCLLHHSHMGEAILLQDKWARDWHHVLSDQLFYRKQQGP